jgi:hypothetical protein
MTTLLEKLQKIEDVDSRWIAVLLRHGERETIPAGTYGNDVQLTPNGVADSTRFGEVLSCFKVRRIYTSPVPRCVQTAECIKKGVSSSAPEIICDDMLGNPGFHIADADIAGKAYLEYGCVGVYERFSRGEVVDGLASADFLRVHPMQWLKAKSSEKGVTLFVTHDALIAHFAFANGLHAYDAENWINFLDGIILDFT